MTALSMPPQGWRAWLLSPMPGSRLQARLGNLYLGWLAFLANPLALVGLAIVLALVLTALFAPLLAPGSPYAQGTSIRAWCMAGASPSPSSSWWP